MTETEISQHIQEVILKTVYKEEKQRTEALYDFLALSMPNISEDQLKQLSSLIPQLSQALYLKWSKQCAERMLETVSKQQLIELCQPTKDNEAAIILVYLMFMESARMEKEIKKDLSEQQLPNNNPELTAAISAYMQAQLSTLNPKQ
ncbi:hypothetical protein [Desulfovibrio litoralis]|uniref:Uncharacterized protein n=1 Tax=Desulfovibrio litoralis DSM 11393 TaxID=1121455 RepID=A0A1M7T6S7_9BACT|nr:hypothetical protein [Desulfovibrio litoralis]SHN66352.1 hypothetical protein SAMN02745728_01624 [Desulfovibrio litoralis DSM 11393]